MADESELRRLLEREAAGAPATNLDPARLVRRTRARRLPRQVAAGGVLTLAVMGIGVGTVTGVRMLNPPSEVTAADSGGDAAEEELGTLSGGPEPEDGAAGGAAGGGATELAPAYKVNFCGGMLGAASDPGLTGIDVDVEFPAEADTGDTVRGSVEITNDTGERITGVVSDVAATTLSQENTVLWHTPRMERTLPVELAPGESTTLEASFEPRVCSAEDEGLEDFRPGLPEVEPGTYEVSVAFDIERVDGFVLQVVSEPTPITLR